MVRLQRMPDAEQRTEARTREETCLRDIRVLRDQVHNCARDECRQNPSRVQLQLRLRELDGSAVWSVSVCGNPRVFPPGEGQLVSEAFGNHHAFECGQPI